MNWVNIKREEEEEKRQGKPNRTEPNRRGIENDSSDNCKLGRGEVTGREGDWGWVWARDKLEAPKKVQRKEKKRNTTTLKIIDRFATFLYIPTHSYFRSHCFAALQLLLLTEKKHYGCVCVCIHV